MLEKENATESVFRGGIRRPLALGQ